MKAENDAGILHGWATIGRHWGLSEDTARNRALAQGMPVVRDGRNVWIRRATLDAWLAEREEEARKASGAE